LDAGESVPDQLRRALNSNKARVIDLFRQLDDDGSGSISAVEFIKAMGELGMAAPPEAITSIFLSFDPDSSGTIEYRELEKLLRHSLQKHPTLKQIDQSTHSNLMALAARKKSIGAAAKATPQPATASPQPAATQVPAATASQPAAQPPAKAVAGASLRGASSAPDRWVMEMLDQIVDLAIENAAAQREGTALRTRSPLSAHMGDQKLKYGSPVRLPMVHWQSSPPSPFQPTGEGRISRRSQPMHIEAAASREVAWLKFLKSNERRSPEPDWSSREPSPTSASIPSVAGDPTSDFWVLDEFNGILEELRTVHAGPGIDGVKQNVMTC